jgi:hypothetical protein
MAKKIAFVKGPWDCFLEVLKNVFASFLHFRRQLKQHMNFN